MWSPCHTTALVALSGISVSVTQHPCREPFHSQVSDHRNSASVSEPGPTEQEDMQKEPSLQT